MTATSLRARIDVPAVPFQRVHDPAIAALASRIPFRGPSSPQGGERARVSGELPAWLRGDLVRVAPWFDATPNWTPSHWFDALGLVFGFEIGAEQIDLRWAVLDGELRAAAARGKVPLAHFGTPNQRGPIDRLLHPIPRLTDNTNVNVVRLGETWVALTETPIQNVLDPRTLAVRGRVQYQDSLGGGSMLAHPILTGDRVTNVSIRLGPQSEFALFDHEAHSRARRVRARWKTREAPYVHSFGLTSQHGILIDHPLRVRPQSLLWSNRAVIEHYYWDRASATRLIRLELNGGEPTVHETEPLFCFHAVHAFETPDDTVLDLVAYENADIISAFSVKKLAESFASARTRLIRLSIDRRTGRVNRRDLSDQSFEFPQVDWELAAHGEENVVFGTDFTPEGAYVRSRIVRIELASGAVQSFSDPDYYVLGEPVFVGKPGRTQEADGVLLIVGSSDRGAALFVLDASTLEPLARAEFATQLPFGFHGNFAAA